ncbi:hypothetical protein UPYG_G00284660 [Umbra pygmaea]|uniref:EGF-like domain-containing protein n=1 Tax=Umbra pygmaea TaxID=75934 RepID=A0ABD0W8E2_UMBPY
MAKTYKLYVGIATALALCKYSLAEGNATEDKAGNNTVSFHQGNTDNFTETQTKFEWDDSFTKCPQKYRHYCIHGVCRFMKQQRTPSCRCNNGYYGARCEYIDIAWQKGDQRQIIIACVIAALVFLILLIIFICICAHRHKLCRRKRRKEDMGNVTEKLNMITLDTSRTQEATSNSVAISNTKAA